MVISHKHKYLFIALPRTGSNAIAKELIEQYDGENILNHHALYQDFYRMANNEERRYKVIIGVRNPLDSVISSYFKYKVGHHEIYKKPTLHKVGRLRRYVRYYTDTRRYRWVTRHDASFKEYFMKFYHLPYADWSMLDKNKFDYVIRFERIQEDFASTLKALGIAQVRPLPVRNKTDTSEERSIPRLISDPETISRAKRVFGPFMKLWGYDMPEEWRKEESTLGKLLFPPVSGIYSFYWRYLR